MEFLITTILDNLLTQFVLYGLTKVDGCENSFVFIFQKSEVNRHKWEGRNDSFEVTLAVEDRDFC